MGIHHGITHEVIPCHLTYPIRWIHPVKRIEHLLVHEGTCLLFRVYILQFHQHHRVGLVAILLHEERYQDTIHLADDVRLLRLLKEITLRQQRQFPLDAVGFGELPNLENLLLPDHIFSNLYGFLLPNALNVRTNPIQPFVNVLIAAVDLVDIVDNALALCAHRRDQQGNTSTNIRRDHR